MWLLVLIALRQGLIPDDRLLTRVTDGCRGPKPGVLSASPPTSGFAGVWWAKSAGSSWQGLVPAAEIPELTAAPPGPCWGGAGRRGPQRAKCSPVGLGPAGLLAFRGKAVRGGDSGTEPGAGFQLGDSTTQCLLRPPWQCIARGTRRLKRAAPVQRGESSPNLGHRESGGGLWGCLIYISVLKYVRWAGR